MTEAAFAFDDDVQLPKRRGKPAAAGVARRIPFDEFPIGKSYFVAAGNSSTVSGAIGAYERRFPEKQFSMRYFETDPKAGVAGVRVWRVR